MAIFSKKIVLVAVLDWGLGHASRSIPLINELQRQGVQVILASSSRAGLLLQKHFPELLYLECPAYDIHYRGGHFYWNILWQLPKMFLAILREHRWLIRMVKIYQIDAVISDSRFGCYHSTIPSVILTHQLNLPLRPPILAKLVNWVYHRWLRQFQAIWVPDFPNGLSGVLSYPSPFEITHFVGCLSRFTPTVSATKWDLLVVLSGPEPQRTRLEEIVLTQLQQLEGIKALVVQGKTEEENRQQINASLEVISYLSGNALLEALAGAEFVLCRAGYSSLMDLAILQKKAILIPTPGQPEQEYLAKRCERHSWAIVVPAQIDLAISDAVEMARQSNRKLGFPQMDPEQRLGKIITQFLSEL